MTEKETDELENIELDLEVAKSQGLNVYINEYSIGCFIIKDMDNEKQYTIDWNFISKIIERDNINYYIYDNKCWFDYYYHSDYERFNEGFGVCAEGKSKLEAIKKCIVKKYYLKE